MRRTTIGALILAVSASLPGRGAGAGAGAPPRVSITIDGKAIEAAVLPIEGDGRTVAPGDLVNLSDFVPTRGVEPTLRLRRGPGRLYLQGNDGKETVVAAVAATLRPGQDPEGDVQDGGTRHVGVKPEQDTLTSLSDAEIAGLRCVRLVNPTDAMVERLGKADMARCSFVVANGEDDPVPRLPRGARIVLLGVGLSDQGPADLAPLATLPDLEVLHLGWRFEAETDLSPLAGLVHLRYLNLGHRSVTHLEALGSLRGLRALDASGCRNLGDLSFARGLASLERIDLAITPLTDLSPLSNLANLRAVDADGSGVRTLPSGALPALRTLRLLSAPVTPEAVEAFRSAHPSCDVVTRRRDLLLAATRGVHRVRVRSGGTCHRRPDAEQTLAEVQDPKEVRALLDLFRFDDTKELGCCMCCGSPTFELYAGSELRVSLGFHHGQALRWPGGEWPGDAQLTDEAGDRLCRWLAERGVPEPAAARAAQRREEARARRRDERQVALLPGGKAEALRAAPNADAGVDLIVQWFPEAKDGVLLAFRLLGAAPPRHLDGVTVTATALLERVDVEVALPIAQAAIGEPEAGRGVGFWLLPRLTSDRPGNELLESLFPAVAKRLLEDPDEDVQEFAAFWAARGPRAEAVAALRRVLRDRPSPAARPGTGAGPAARSTHAIRHAIYGLLRLGDLESLPVMREIAAGWSAEERAQFESEAAELEGSEFPK